MRHLCLWCRIDGLGLPRSGVSGMLGFSGLRLWAHLQVKVY